MAIFATRHPSSMSSSFVTGNVKDGCAAATASTISLASTTATPPDCILILQLFLQLLLRTMAGRMRHTVAGIVSPGKIPSTGNTQHTVQCTGITLHAKYGERVSPHSRKTNSMKPKTTFLRLSAGILCFFFPPNHFFNADAKHENLDKVCPLRFLLRIFFLKKTERRSPIFFKFLIFDFWILIFWFF